ncbi:hypothetical protein ACQEV2_41270 [Streptomyces sp. CA-251387]|uniref:hypothetical protein n=1 Tax=Streptomyces sp. CA-251387 TaxID=3240064 RepID=UPI003D8AB61F
MNIEHAAIYALLGEAYICRRNSRTEPPSLRRDCTQVHLREIGVPSQRGRTSAIRQLVLQAPAPVTAKALGYHDKTTTRLGTEAGGTWSRHAPGDH